MFCWHLMNRSEPSSNFGSNGTSNLVADFESFRGNLALKVNDGFSYLSTTLLFGFDFFSGKYLKASRKARFNWVKGANCKKFYFSTSVRLTYLSNVFSITSISSSVFNASKASSVRKLPFKSIGSLSRFSLLGSKLAAFGIRLGRVLGFSESGPSAATCVSGSSLRWNVVVAAKNKYLIKRFLYKMLKYNELVVGFNFFLFLPRRMSSSSICCSLMQVFTFLKSTLSISFTPSPTCTLPKEVLGRISSLRKCLFLRSSFAPALLGLRPPVSVLLCDISDEGFQ